MTNIISAVVIALVTNVTETLPQMTVPTSGPPGSEYDLVLYTKTVPVPNPTEKWITTSIVEVASVTNFHGTLAIVGRGERPITNWTTRFIIVPPPPPSWIAAPNNSPIPLWWPVGGMIGR